MQIHNTELNENLNESLFTCMNLFREISGEEKLRHTNLVP